MDEFAINFKAHQDCQSLSSLFQGGLCETLTARKGRLFESNQIIYGIGDRASSVFFLRQGLVKLNAVSSDGKEVILSVHKPNEIFGEFCLCEGKRNEMAVAMETSEIVEIRFEELLEQLQQNHEAMLNFLISVCQRLSKAHQIISEFSFDNLPKRLARALLRLADDIGQESPNGTELTHYITQEELAQMVSARREVVSTALSRLRDRQLVFYSRKGKLTINRSAMLAYVESEAEETLQSKAQKVRTV
jgi:CRP/FNR family transcriptional regulator, cyclic AMP receptor protein